MINLEQGSPKEKTYQAIRDLADKHGSCYFSAETVSSITGIPVEATKAICHQLHNLGAVIYTDGDVILDRSNDW